MVYFENEIHIYGHSLDAADKDILSRIIMTRLTTTYVYYISKEDLAKKIRNLVQVIGKKNLVQMTGGMVRSIRFVETGKKPEGINKWQKEIDVMINNSCQLLFDRWRCMA